MNGIQDNQRLEFVQSASRHIGTERKLSMGKSTGKNKKWSEDELNFLRENVNKLDNGKLSIEIGCSKSSVKEALRYYKIRRDEAFSRSLLNPIGKFSGDKHPMWKGGISKDLTYWWRLHKDKYPERARAREIAKYAVRSGKIKRMPCEMCNSKKSHHHHEDYSKPLDLTWLCQKHHVERHKEKDGWGRNMKAIEI